VALGEGADTTPACMGAGDGSGIALGCETTVAAEAGLAGLAGAESSGAGADGDGAGAGDGPLLAVVALLLRGSVWSVPAARAACARADRGRSPRAVLALELRRQLGVLALNAHPWARPAAFAAPAAYAAWRRRETARVTALLATVDPPAVDPPAAAELPTSSPEDYHGTSPPSLHQPAHPSTYP
jgi:hypothetical protein